MVCNAPMNHAALDTDLDDRPRLPELTAKQPEQFDNVLRQRGAYRESLHVKFAASSVLPDPLYTASAGYGQSGRVRSVVPFTTRDALICSGAVFCSTHCSSALRP